MLKFTPRMWLILVHDLIATVIAILASFYIRFEESFLVERQVLLLVLMPAIVLYAAGVYMAFGLNKSSQPMHPSVSGPAIPGHGTTLSRERSARSGRRR